ncbi:MAG: 50S ribosomal protein L18 [Alcanivorax sp.]|uniref:Large ribosomal subunit protein uL18 n=2 Tax=Alloalcanivorax TaxID=3020832 RepID=A0A9Q3UKP9_9GAMM|nr:MULTISPECIES: 50S ribosomal protein L18 [Alloalcanivorax]MBM7334047.1 50S ribosomal protein L18 [Alloalcanivorax marinus]MCC4308772.1 50S ribosomal protein L18 [Alloalcanivorax marinus]|tara:strand:- start:2842 stop:3192 length:351 start_codon:yes stop_codon:yes gene_type:complete
MMDKKVARLRRAKRTRLNIRESGQIRLSVHRTPRHIYAQITSAAGDQVLVAASTVEKDLRGGATGNADAAAKVGEMIAKRAKEAGIERVAFDRSGFRYHGRIKALADAARENGLEF